MSIIIKSNGIPEGEYVSKKELLKAIDFLISNYKISDWTVHYAIVGLINSGFEQSINKIQIIPPPFIRENVPNGDKTESYPYLIDCDISVRALNCLRANSGNVFGKRSGELTVKDISLQTKHEIMKIRNLGRQTLREIEDLLEKHGLTFKK